MNNADNSVFDYFLGDGPDLLSIEEMRNWITEKLGIDASGLNRREMDALMEANHEKFLD